MPSRAVAVGLAVWLLTAAAPHEAGPALRFLSVTTTKVTEQRFDGSKPTRHARVVLLFRLGFGPKVNRERLAGVDGKAAITPIGGKAIASQALLLERDGEDLVEIRSGPLPVGATRLKSVAATAYMYPSARRARFHLPWLKDDAGETIETDGASARIERFELAGDRTSIWISVRPPAGHRVGQAEGPRAPLGQAMDIYGNIVRARQDGRLTAAAPGEPGQFRFRIDGPTRLPSRLMLDVPFVGGIPEPTPLTAADIPLTLAQRVGNHARD